MFSHLPPRSPQREHPSVNRPRKRHFSSCTENLMYACHYWSDIDSTISVWLWHLYPWNVNTILCLHFKPSQQSRIKRSSLISCVESGGHCIEVLMNDSDIISNPPQINQPSGWHLRHTDCLLSVFIERALPPSDAGAILITRALPYNTRQLAAAEEAQISDGEPHRISAHVSFWKICTAQGISLKRAYRRVRKSSWC